MPRCLFCDVELVKGKTISKEHIIPNAIGGILTSTELLCSACNSGCGNDCDAALAKDFETCSNLLNIKRADGNTPPKIAAKIGEIPIKLKAGWKPELAKPECKLVKDGNKLQGEIKARSKSEARIILSGLAKKYPINIEASMNALVEKDECPDEFVNISIKLGGEGTFRAITKMAYLFLKHKHPKIILGSDDAIKNFIRGKGEYKEAYFYFPDTPIVAKKQDQLFHHIAIKSYKKEGILLAYIELFSVASFVVMLSDNFHEDIEDCYVFDVLEHKELTPSKAVFPNIDKETCNRIFIDKPFPTELYANRYRQLLAISLKRQHEAKLIRLIDEAVEKVLCQYPEGTLMDDKIIKELSNAVTMNLLPFIGLRH